MRATSAPLNQTAFRRCGLLVDSGHQGQQFTSHAAILDDEPTYTHRKLESPRPRAAGIEVEHSVACLLLGNVAVPAHHHRKSSRLGLKVQLRQIVQHVDKNPTKFNRLRFRQPAGPPRFVYVAPHSGDRGNARKLFEDLSRTYVPGVNNVIRPAEGLEGRRPQQPVRVGDDAD
jgi:hypothetical protein